MSETRTTENAALPSEPFNLDQMRLVVRLDAERSFTRAAAALGITQSAVSQQIATIERQLGRRLFRRGGTGLSPTEDGEAYLVYARAMLAIGEDAKRYFAAGRGLEQIRLGLNEDFARTALPAVLALFARDHPSFAFVVECGLSGTLFADLDSGRFDVVVGKRPARAEQGGSGSEILWHEPLGWFGRNDTVLPADAPVPLALVPAPSITHAAVIDTLRAAGRSWRILFQSMSFATIEAVVQHGVGIAASGRLLGMPGLVELDAASHGLPELPAVAICMRRRPDGGNPALDAFCDLLRQVALLAGGHDTQGQNAVHRPRPQSGPTFPPDP